MIFKKHARTTTNILSTFRQAQVTEYKEVKYLRIDPVEKNYPYCAIQNQTN